MNAGWNLVGVHDPGQKVPAGNPGLGNQMLDRLWIGIYSKTIQTKDLNKNKNYQTWKKKSFSSQRKGDIKPRK